jgi:hypothetical protein
MVSKISVFAKKDHSNNGKDVKELRFDNRQNEFK